MSHAITTSTGKKRRHNLDKSHASSERARPEKLEFKIKESFPYFEIFDEVMGDDDRIDPSKIEIEGSSTLTSDPSVNDASQNDSVNDG